MKSSRAISAFERPRAIRRSTSCSRAVRLASSFNGVGRRIRLNCAITLLVTVGDRSTSPAATVRMAAIRGPRPWSRRGGSAAGGHGRLRAPRIQPWTNGRTVAVSGHQSYAAKRAEKSGQLAEAGGSAVSQDLREIMESYGRTWDVDTPGGLVEEVFAPDVVDHSPQPGQPDGIDGIKMGIGLYHAVFPDLHISNDDVIVSGDRGVLRWSATGTHEGDQLGVPATHQTVRLTGIDIVRIADGRVVERWGEANGLEMMQQLQALPGSSAT